LSFDALNKQLKEIENAAGRDRNAPKFSARTLDIDIVLQLDEEDEIVYESDEITQYNFVSEPLKEIL
jgi:2-amino-4-hydroxy-6-hydroxymethyldihydropteridine diphosphokinase